MAQPMSYGLASFTARYYVCARCWHPLLVTHHDSRDWLECSNAANCDGQGFVTKGYAARRLEQSYADLDDARANLSFILPARPKRSEKELLSELGF